MKKLIAIGLVLGVFSILEATNIPVAENSMTVLTVQVSSQTATAVPSAANVMKNRTVVYLQNQDTSYDVFCGSGVISSTGTNTFMLPKDKTMIRFDARGFNFYCLTDGNVTHSTVTVIQAY